MQYAVMAENRWNDKCVRTTKEALNAVLDYLFIFYPDNNNNNTSFNSVKSQFLSLIHI